MFQLKGNTVQLICEVIVIDVQAELIESIMLYHIPLVPDICVSESGQYWFR